MTPSEASSGATPAGGHLVDAPRVATPPVGRAAAASPEPTAGSLKRAPAARLAWLVLRWAWMTSGLTLLAFGIRLQVMADLGLSPWDVLHLGLTLHSPITFGQASQVVGLVLVAAALAIGYPPRTGTLFNMWYVGAIYDVIAARAGVPVPANLAARWAYLLAGVGMLAAGSAWYLSAQLGGGPRDGMMLAVAGRLRRAGKTRDGSQDGGRTPGGTRPGRSEPPGRTIGWVRAVLEGSATALGYLLGGPVGPGTVVAAALIGPAMALSIPRFSFSRRWWSGQAGPIHDHGGKQVPG